MNEQEEEFRNQLEDIDEEDLGITPKDPEKWNAARWKAGCLQERLHAKHWEKSCKKHESNQEHRTLAQMPESNERD